MPGNRSLLTSLLAFARSLLLSAPPSTRSKGTAFETLSVEQGMPTAVICILQDRTGYLWFGRIGPYRYDGYNFVSYKHDPDDASSIVDNNANPMYEDKAGVLWVGSPFGLQKFDRTTGTFSHYTPYPPAELRSLAIAFRQFVKTETAYSGSGLPGSASIQ